MRKALVTGLITILSSTTALGGALAAGTGTAGAAGGAEHTAAHRAPASLTPHTSWRATVPPVPSAPVDPGQVLGPVSCTSVGNCTSVGTELSSTGRSVLTMFTETTSGPTSSWTAVALTRPANSGTEPLNPRAISCQSPGNCVAVANGPEEVSVSSSGSNITTVHGSALYTAGLRGHLGDRSRQPRSETYYKGSAIVIFQEVNSVWTSFVAAAPPSGGSSDEYALFGGLSCAGGSCTVTALYGTKLPRPVAIAGLGGASPWAASFLPLPSGAVLTDGGPDVAGVSCTAATTCTAVGTYVTSKEKAFGLLLTETTGTWHASSAPAPAPNEQSELSSVSCTAVGVCTAAGVALSKSLAPEVAVESAGSWKASTLSPPGGLTSKGLAEFVQVECTDATDCLAVGESVTVTGVLSIHEAGFIAEETSSGWTTRKALLPAGTASGGNSELEWSACSSPGNCAVAGEAVGTGGDDVGIVDQQTGGEWTARAIPVSDPEIARNDTSALLDAQLPRLVRQQLAPALRAQATSEQRSALRSRADRLPSALQPRTGSVGLLALLVENISCPADGTCVAVGAYVDSYGNVHGVAATVSSAGVVSSAIPVLPGSGFNDRVAAINDVACKSDGTCVAVGSVVSEYSGASSSALVDTWQGGHWTTASFSAPGQAAGELEFSTVTCSGRDGCTAIGAADSGSGIEAIAGVQTGNSWKVTVLSLPGGLTASDDIAPVAVACAGGNCAVTADAELDLLIGDTPNVIWWYHDGTWSGHVTPSAPGSKTPGALVGSIGCSTATDCVATGLSSLTSLNAAPFVIQGAGSSWHAIKVSTPPGGVASFIESVSCLGGRQCEVVGGEISKTAEDGLIVSVDGSKVASVVSPVPSGGVAGVSELESVSCGSRVCTAAGGYSDGTVNHVSPDVVFGRGISFAADKTPTPKGISQAALGIISCDSAAYCGAIGETEDGSSYLASGSDSHWSAAKVPTPASAEAASAELTDIACGSLNRCVASGEYVSKQPLGGETLTFVVVES